MVFSATHTRTGLRAAVKFLLAERSDPDRRARFRREGRAANRLRHPGAVSVFADGEHRGHAFLVMDLVQGRNLQQRFPPGTRGSLAEVAPIVDAVLDALAAAHAVGVVHRDLKPDNILIGDDGVVRIIDLGLASLGGDDQPGLTRPGIPLGTPAFLSPEQALGRVADVGERSDLFAVAATARALLTGRAVHEGETGAEVIVAAATRQVAPTLSVLPSLDPRVAAVLDKALSFRPEDRYPDARSMRDAWASALTGWAGATQVIARPLGAGPGGFRGASPSASAQRGHAPLALGVAEPQPPTIRGRTRRVWAIAVAAIGLAAVAGGTAVGIVLGARAPAERTSPTAFESGVDLRSLGALFEALIEEHGPDAEYLTVGLMEGGLGYAHLVDGAGCQVVIYQVRERTFLPPRPVPCFGMDRFRLTRGLRAGVTGAAERYMGAAELDGTVAFMVMRLSQRRYRVTLSSSDDFQVSEFDLPDDQQSRD